jgi:hypothetical protein
MLHVRLRRIRFRVRRKKLSCCSGSLRNWIGFHMIPLSRSRPLKSSASWNRERSVRALGTMGASGEDVVWYVIVHFVHTLHDLRNDIVLGLTTRRVSHLALWVRRSGPESHHTSLTSISSRLSCCPMHRNTFFLLLSCISPASRSSSRMKYAFWKLKMMSSSHTLP